MVGDESTMTSRWLLREKSVRWPLVLLIVGVILMFVSTGVTIYNIAIGNATDD